MKSICILVGNIGSGKSTYVKKRVAAGFNGVVISRDALRYMLGAGKYIFDLKYESAVWKSETELIKKFMAINVNIIVDEVGVSKNLRKKYIQLAKQFGYDVCVAEMPRLSKKCCVDRRMQDPHQCPDRKMWEQVWEKFDKLYQMPSLKEGIDYFIPL